MGIESRLFINGEFRDSASGQTFDFVGTRNKDTIAVVQEAGEADVELAVAAAEAAQPAWAAKSGYERAQLLLKWGALINENKAELARLDAISMGKPVSFAAYEMIMVEEALAHFAALVMYAAGEASLNTPGHVNLVLKQPYGVVAGIIPWNFTALMATWKLGAAIGAGNAMILKSSEKAPLVPLYLAKLSKDAGIPNGVISVLSGAGTTGKLLSEHMRIRKIAFTGSTRTGRAIQVAAANSNLKNVSLELGGKSPTIIFADADLAAAAAGAAGGIMTNSGQVCVAGTRLYVEKSAEAEFTKHFTAALAGYTSGSVEAATTSLGPLADSIQGKAVTNYIEVGKTEGTVLVGGKRLNEAEGWAIEPTVFTNVADNARINKEEIFGPVVVLHTFETEAEALQRANDTEYGLHSCVWTKDINKALRIAKGLEAGSVGVNCGTMSAAADMPFGGYKTSGVGREKGHDSINSWLETKAVFIKVSDA